MSPPRAVLLDLYDTLAWTEWSRFRAIASERTGIPPRRLMRAFHRTRPRRSVGAYGSEEGNLRAVLQDAGLRPSEDLVGELVRLQQDVLAAGVHLWDDVLPTLAELRRRGTPMAVVSNCDHATRSIVERIGLTAAVDAVILSFEVGVAKPEPGIYRAALDALDGVAPTEAVFVDDQTPYLDGAAALGLETALILRDDASPIEGVRDPGSHRVVRDLRQVLALL